MGLFAELILLILLFPFLLLFLGALVRILAHDAIYNRPTWAANLILATR